MFDIPEPKTGNRHESTWDNHGSYQWTYFADAVKQRISYFLLQRLNGHNLEVGGGWYLSYPDSVVVDLSSVCLSHNPAKEKLQFDLDSIVEGARLPFNDNSFNSATIISVWQYLSHPEEVLGELERVLRPGAEMYLINGQGAGLDECKVGITTTKQLEKFFQDLGYDTLIEHIPAFDSTRIDEFQSLCVAMPDIDLFGVTPSRILNKVDREERDKEICEKRSIFNNAFIEWEIRNVALKLMELDHYPVTEYSQEYLAKVEAFSQECYKKTGLTPLIFMDCIEPKLAMLTPDSEGLFERMVLVGQDEEECNNVFGDERHKLVSKLEKKYELKFIKSIGYFGYKENISELLEKCAKFKPVKEDRWRGISGNMHELRSYVEFISSYSRNSHTRDLQRQMYDLLKSNVPDLNQRIEREEVRCLHYATYENKQERRIDKLIAVKEKILTEAIPIIEMRKFDYQRLLPQVKRHIK